MKALQQQHPVPVTDRCDAVVRPPAPYPIMVLAMTHTGAERQAHSGKDKEERRKEEGERRGGRQRGRSGAAAKKARRGGHKEGGEEESRRRVGVERGGKVEDREEVEGEEREEDWGPD